MRSHTLTPAALAAAKSKAKESTKKTAKAIGGKDKTIASPKSKDNG